MTEKLWFDFGMGAGDFLCLSFMVRASITPFKRGRIIVPNLEPLQH